MDSVFVTGGTGFLGRHLIPALCRAGFGIRVLTRQAAANPWLARYPNLSIVEGDINDAEAVRQGVQGSRYIVHAAGFFRFWGEDTAFERTNVGGTQNLLEAARTADAERIVHISSIAVIGDPDPSRIVDETHPAHPADPYQRSKLAAETLALSYHHAHGLPVIILRPGAFYGEMGNYAFNRLFFRDPMRGIIMQINGGTYITFPAYVPDVAQAILASLHLGRAGQIYNICDDPITHKETFDIITREAQLWFPRIPLPGWLGILSARLLTQAAAITGREPFYPINLRSYVYNYWHVSNQKARDELRFVPTPFAEGARRTIAWYRAGRPDTLPSVECP
ncbi:MAG: NAD-dependent epimerase/dehydratase family protein [bacterium]|nr:NAD-dependent epimerase/dehydratase family protein [bacterium]